MNNLVTKFKRLSVQERVFLTVLGASIAVILFSHVLVASPAMAPLYQAPPSNLEIARIVHTLNEWGVTHEIHDEIVYVPRDELSSIRMRLQTESLEPQNRDGFAFLRNKEFWQSVDSNIESESNMIQGSYSREGN